ncbi:TolC family protein [Flagellimonas beolgyonensis]|uniref:TolC family protein n=1 Tax=Flagellimonas beolgyonensis TaxID=864064 RepID=UPI003D6532E1
MDNSIPKMMDNRQKLRVLGFFLALCLPWSGGAQQPCPIDSLWAMVDRDFPTKHQMGLNLENGDLVQKALNTNWYPKVGAEGSATYQSEVTSFSLPGLPAGSVPVPAKDQYKIGLVLSQTLFDAGMTRAKKQLERLNTLAKSHAYQAELLNVKGTVLDLATSIMIAKNSVRQLEHSWENLQNRAKNVELAIANGEALAVEGEEIEVAILEMERQIQGTLSQIQTAYGTLQVLTGMATGDRPDFTFPQMEEGHGGDFGLRPEVQALDNELLGLEWQKKELDRKALPRLSLFLDGYYGRPGFNFLDNDFRVYGIGGVELSFPITSLGYNRSLKKGLAIQRESVVLEKRKLTDQLTIQEIQLSKALETVQVYLEEDVRIVALRQKILGTAQIQFDNGSLLFSEYLEKLHNYQNAKIDLRIHELQESQLRYRQRLLFNTNTNP